MKIAVNRGAKWQEISGFAVNVSEHGLLVTLDEAPAVGEWVWVQLPASGDFWGQAVVRHAIRGSANYLVGMRLQEQSGAWLVPQPPP